MMCPLRSSLLGMMVGHLEVDTWLIAHGRGFGCDKFTFFLVGFAVTLSRFVDS